MSDLCYLRKPRLSDWVNTHSTGTHTKLHTSTPLFIAKYLGGILDSITRNLKIFCFCLWYPSHVSTRFNSNKNYIHTHIEVTKVTTSYCRRRIALTSDILFYVQQIDKGNHLRILMEFFLNIFHWIQRIQWQKFMTLKGLEPATQPPLV